MQVYHSTLEVFAIKFAASLEETVAPAPVTHTSFALQTCVIVYAKAFLLCVTTPYFAPVSAPLFSEIQKAIEMIAGRPKI